MPRDADARIKNLEDKVAQLQRNPGASSGIGRTIGTLEKRVIEDTVSDTILELAWNKYFYLMSDFAADGWSVTSAASPSVTGSGLTLETTTTTDNRSLAYRKIKFQQVMSFNEESRFRTLFYLDIDSDAADIDYSLSIGSGIPTPLSNRYGFRLHNNSFLGVCSNGTTESTVNLFNTDTAQGGGLETFIYLVEARYYPGSRVDFYTSEAGSTEVQFRASLTTNLPSGYDETGIHFDLYTRTTTAKRAFVDFAEYIQKRPIK